jgi:hypothetical protein
MTVYSPLSSLRTDQAGGKGAEPQNVPVGIHWWCSFGINAGPWKTRNEVASKRLSDRQSSFDLLETILKIRAGYDIAFYSPHETAMALMLSVHPSRQKDLRTEHRVQLSNGIPSHDYRDAFGNICTRLVAPPGLLGIRNDFVIADSGLPDEVVLDAPQWDVAALPDETLLYLLGSRYCDTQKLFRPCMVPIRRHKWRLAARAGDLRLRA